MTWLDKHTFPRLARSTLNELQQNQHEKASLVCVRGQSPSGLALVPCALSMVNLSGPLRCWITRTEKCFVLIFGTLCSYDPRWRGFFAWRQKTASLLIDVVPESWFCWYLDRILELIKSELCQGGKFWYGSIYVFKNGTWWMYPPGKTIRYYTVYRR